MRAFTRRVSHSSSAGLLDGVSLLLVEDDPASSRLYTAVLSAAGAKVTTVETALAALETLQTFLPRVLLVDIVLPDSNGLALVKVLKADDRTRGIVCIAITVLNGPDTERAARDAGCSDYVRKPVDSEALAALIASHLKETP